MKSKFRGCLIGLALGDALGAPYEGAIDPINIDLEKLKIEKQLKYTDDTIMALCIAESITENRAFSQKDIAERYLKWYLSGDLRGIGLTVNRALRKYSRTRDPKTSGVIDFWAAGNGVAMRIAPIALYDINSTEEVLYEHIRLDGQITHRNELAISGAFAVALAIKKAIRAKSKEEILEYVKTQLERFGILNRVYDSLIKVSELIERETVDQEAFKILGTSGFVVHTVSSALFSFMYHNNFLDSILSIIRAGDDTDTNAAVTGSIAGAYYGYDAIPNELINRLENRQEIIKLADEIYMIATHIE